MRKFNKLKIDEISDKTILLLYKLSDFSFLIFSVSHLNLNKQKI